MAVKVLAKRGTAAQITATTAANQTAGEIAFATDTKDFYVSDGTQFNKIGKDELSQFSEISVESNIDTWHLSDTNRLDLSPPESNPTGIIFKPDGTRVFTIGYSRNRVQSYDLSTAWDLTSAGSPTESEYLVQNNLGSTQEDFFIDSSGTRMYVLSRSSDSVGQFTLNTAWDISDITFVQDVHMNSTGLSGGVAGFATGEGNPMGMTFKPDGTIMYLVGYTTDDVFQIPLSTAWDISTHGTITSVDVSIEGTPNAVQFNNDGTVMYIMGYSTDAILQYNLSTAWDVTTASFVKRTSAFIRPLEGTGSGFYYNETEQKAFVCGRSSDFAYEVIISEALRFSDLVSAEVLQGDKVIANTLVTGYTGRNDFFNSTYTNAHFQTYSTTYLGYNQGPQNIRVGNTVYGNYRFHVFQWNYINNDFISNPTGALPNIRFFNPVIGGVGVFSIGKTHNTDSAYLLGGVTDIESEADTFDHKGEITLGGELKVSGNQPLKYKDPNLYTQGTQIVLDNFNETTQTTLDNHTPDTGSGYTNVYISPNISFPTHLPIIIANAGYLRPYSSNSNDGYRFVNNTIISTANYEARAVIRKQSSGDDPFVLFVKYIDEDNYFAMHFAGNYSYCTPISVVNGVHTQHGALYYYANTSTADNVNFEVALRVVGNNVHVFYEGRYRGSREVNITGIGKAGIGFGRSNNSILTSYDLSTNARISKFEIYELPDSLFGGSDSVHYIENGGLGIGTTSIGTAKVVIDHTNTKMLELKRNGATKARFIADSNNGQLDLYDSSTVNSVRLLSSGNSYFNGGNVGIGTTIPSAKLHLLSTTHSDFLDNGILLDVNSSDEGEPAIAFRNQSDMGSNYWITGINNGGQNLDFAYGTAFTSANTKVRFTSDGNVGIGTTNPAVKLTVNGGNIRRTHDANNYSQMGAGSSGGFINGFSGNTEKFMIRSYASNGVQAFFTAGNVGIGTTSPSEKLHLDGNIRVDSDEIYITQSSSSRKPVRLHQATYKGAITLQRDGVDNVNISSDQPYQGHTYFNGNGVNVGIGTSAPTSTLHVAGTARIHSAANGAYGTLTLGSINDIVGDVTYIDFKNNGSSWMRINNGNVGIGTTNPYATLTVAGNITQTDNSYLISTRKITARDAAGLSLYNDGGEGIDIKDSGDIKISANKNIFSDGSITIGIDYNNNETDRVFNIIANNSTEVFRVQEDGNVGIGTTSPTEKLHVVGETNLNGHLNFIGSRTIGTTGASDDFSVIPARNLNLGTQASDNVYIGRASTWGGSVVIQANAANTMVVTDNKVGIGTTSPQKLLDVNGDVRFKRNIYGADGTYIGFFKDAGGALPIKAGSLTISDTYNDTAPNYGLYVKGNVGIGTTSPTAELHVETSNQSEILSKSTGSSAVFTADGFANSAFVMKENGTLKSEFFYDSINNQMKIRTSSAESLSMGVNNGQNIFIQGSSGKVGIGTTSPAGNLHVVGASGGAGEIYVSDVDNGTGSSDGLLISKSGTNAFIYNRDNGQISFGTNNVSNNLVIANTGNVGIGTTSPTSILDIENDSGVTIDLNSSSGDSQFRFQDNAVTKWSIGRDNTQQNFVFSNSAGLGSDPVLVLTHTDGNVGIGTASPSEKLEVSGTIKVNTENSQIALYRGDGATLIGRLSYTGTTLRIQGNDGIRFEDTNGSTIHGIITDSGNYGIGTTSPSEKLHISGGEVRIDAATTNQPGLEIRNSVGNITSQLSNIGGPSYGILYLYNNGSTHSNSTGAKLASAGNSYFNGGNVGIGTTTPSEKLAVDGNIQLPNGGFIYGQNTGNYLKLDNATYVELGYSSTTAIRADGSDVSIRGVGGTANMTIESGGNVGIGTTSPNASAILDIASTSKGVVFPRMTSAQRTAISSPATGLIVYQTDSTEGLYIYKSTGWTQII